MTADANPRIPTRPGRAGGRHRPAPAAPASAEDGAAPTNVLEMMTGLWGSQAMYVATELGIPDELDAKPRRGATAAADAGQLGVIRPGRRRPLCSHADSRRAAFRRCAQGHGLRCASGSRARGLLFLNRSPAGPLKRSPRSDHCASASLAGRDLQCEKANKNGREFYLLKYI